MKRELSPEYQAAVNLGVISKEAAEREQFGPPRASSKPTAVPEDVSGESRPQNTRRKAGLPALTRFTDIQRRKLEWLWPGRIPMGKISVIAGDPGFGKSLLSIAMAATVTNEAKWPDCGEYAPFGSVVLLSAEDDDGDTIKPRLMSAQADESKVLSLSPIIDLPNGKKRGFSLDTDLDGLTKTLDTVDDLKLLVIDPISAFMGSVDSHNVADVRGVLAGLSELAQRRQFAVLYITHLNKGKGTPMSRVSGSGAFVAAARSAMLVGRDPTDPDRRIIAMLKANLSKESSGIAYRIRTSESGLPVIEWEPGPVDIAPEDLLSLDTGVRRLRDDIIEWLKSQLANGPVDALHIEQSANFAGFSERTLNRAKKELKVVSRREGKAWCWQLPGQDCQPTPPIKGGNLGNLGNLDSNIANIANKSGGV